MFAADFLIQFYTQTGFVGNFQVSIFIDWAVTLYNILPVRQLNAVRFERHKRADGRAGWHAAANIHGLHDSTNISRIQHYTMKLYNELEAETGQGCGVFQSGSLYLAQTEAREHQLRLQEAKRGFMG